MRHVYELETVDIGYWLQLAIDGMELWSMTDGKYRRNMPWAVSCSLLSLGLLSYQAPESRSEVGIVKTTQGGIDLLEKLSFEKKEE